LIKKYKDFSGRDVDEDYAFVREVAFVNGKMIFCKYKEVSLLGD